MQKECSFRHKSVSSVIGFSDEVDISKSDVSQIVTSC